MTDVAVVGGGVGGMAAAIRLAARGHQADLFERRGEVGGTLTEVHRDGFTFGVGRSLLTLPEVFGALAAEAGRKLSDLVSLEPVDPCAGTISPTAACWTRAAPRPRWPRTRCSPSGSRRARAPRRSGHPGPRQQVAQ
jgi:phytoene dehydrogenase-like protein